MSKIFEYDDTSSSVDPAVMEESIENLKKETKVPKGYVPIDLPSNGKLGYAKRVHFKCFSMDDIIDIASSKRDRILFSILRALNANIFEGLDCTQMHEKDIEVIMMTLYSNFQSPVLVDKPYYINTDLEGDELDDKSNIGYINLPIRNIPIKELSGDIKPTFSIVDDQGTRVGFKVPTISDMLASSNYAEEKLYDEESSFTKLISAIEKNEKLPEEKKIVIDRREYDRYSEFKRKKATTFLKALQKQMLVSVGKKKLETIEQKIEADKSIDPAFWGTYNSTLANNKFGLEEEVEFVNPLKKTEKITRRFLFQLLEFIPTMEQENSGKHTVLFGD